MGSMAAFEELKMLALQHSTMRESHLLTIAVNSVAAGYFVMQGGQSL